MAKQQKKTKGIDDEQVETLSGEFEGSDESSESAGADLSSPELATAGEEPKKEPKKIEASKAGFQKVKILKSVGHYMAGEIVEVPDNQVEGLCRIVELHNGAVVQKVQRAMTLKDYEKLQEAVRSSENLTAAEAAELGIKNVIKTPKDDAFEEHLKAIAKVEKHDVI